MYKINKKNLELKINKLSQGRVLVVGDVILDEFIVGSPERISREAPVLILEHLNSTYALGGASNAANNIRALGSKCYLIGVVGDDIYSTKFKDECLKKKITPILIKDKSRPTTVKTRYLSIAHKHPTSSILFKQQILRLDRLSRENIKALIENKIIDAINKNISKSSSVLISDYDLGVCTKKVIQYTIKTANKKNIPVIVDAQSSFERYSGAFIFTPNQPDTESAVGFQIKDSGSLIKAGKKMIEITKAKYILITRGSDGMALFSSSNPEKPFLIPAFNLSEVFDVTGAGDTVAGVIASAISNKYPIQEACILGNLAASLVVRKYGTVVTSISELKASLKNLNL